MYNIFQGKRVLVTGGTGSFGTNFIKSLLEKTAVAKLIVFSRDEFKQHHMEKELADDRVSFFIGDVRDLPRLNRAFKDVDIVIHAAALKQVPALEYNPLEAIKTNVIGTQNIIEAAVDQEVPRVLLVSTDKAAQPVNLYGASKLCAEKLFISANSYSPKKTKFSVVRYGNVVGSRGSIIENLLKNKEAKEVHITNADMTRFWITLNQSFNLVIHALNNMHGGEMFIPKIPSMKLVDLFDTITPNAKKTIVGIRPGEKLHEILITEHESQRAIEHKDYFVVLPENNIWSVKDPYEKHRATGKKLKNGFVFTSDTNKKWLTKGELNKIIKEVKN